MASEAPTPAPPRKFKFPTAFTVLAAVLLLVWIASFFVPAGVYKTDSAGSPTPGTYHELPDCSAPPATAPALDVESATESGQAPADAASAPGATVSEAGIPCVDTSFTFRFKQADTLALLRGDAGTTVTLESTDLELAAAS